MEIILARHAGFCFGVSRAIELTEDAIESNTGNLFSYGPLIHNPQVVDMYFKKGLKPINSIEELNSFNEGKIVSRSHGLPKKTILELEDRNFKLVDTTCPFVKRIHTLVDEYYNKGYNIVIVGKSDHPEVVGINGWCNNQGIIINTKEEALMIKGYDNLLVVSQTTNKYNIFEEISKIITNNNKKVETINTICRATKDRQDSTRSLSKEVDAMIVIGGYSSSNTNKLAEVAKENCKKVYHIETINDLSLQEIAKFNKIGVTAGASTPDWIIKEVIQIMNNENEMNNEMMEAIEDSFTKIHRGDVVTGTVLYVTDTEVMVNIGYTSDGIIDRSELSNDPSVKPRDLYSEGDEINVYVMRLDDGEGNVVLSSKRVKESKTWDELEVKFENKERITAHVVRNVKGGLAVLVDDLNAFMPASHVSVNFVSDLKEFVGQDLECEIIDFDKSKRRIIVSRKEVEKEELDEKRESLWDELEEGALIKGIVRRLTNFGAFVDLGGLDGLIHISDLAWHRVKHPSEIVAVDETVEVQVLGLDKERNRISLGLKQTVEKPWDVFMKEVKEGDIVKGKVVNLLDFGAFVRLEQGVDGLLHVSQISNEHIDKPADVFAIDDEVEVKVISIDEEDQKISLSTKKDSPETDEVETTVEEDQE